MLLNSIGENENSLSNIVTQKRRSSVVYFFKLFIPSTRLDLLTLASHKNNRDEEFEDDLKKCRMCQDSGLYACHI